MRNVEIAGAGLAGLTAATALAQRGWNVRVHERSSELRELGAGIYMWENALRVLESIGAYDEVTAGSEAISIGLLRDHRARVVQRDDMAGNRLFAVPRRHLHRTLAECAQRAGVEIVTDSCVLGAEPSGVLVAESGRFEADLVIGADGVNSAVRDSLGLKVSRRELNDGCGRHLIVRKEDDPVATAIEQWNAGARVGVVPCSPTEVYLFLCCPSDYSDLKQQRPFNRAAWIERFPQFRSQLERIPDNPEGDYHTFGDISVSSWFKGHTAIIGDAAHGMSPNLGLAACTAMVNGLSLATELEQKGRTEDALQRWYDRNLEPTLKVQKYSRYYGKVGTAWPKPKLAQDVRSFLVRTVGNSRPVLDAIRFGAEVYAEPIAAG